MKQVPLVLAFCICSIGQLSAQEYFKSDTVVKGTVTGSRFDITFPIKCIISVIGTDGTSIDVQTDDKGDFFFLNSQVKPNASFVIIVKPDEQNSHTSFLNKTGKFTTIDVLEDDLPIRKDFDIDFFACPLIDFPLITFAQNSTAIEPQENASANLLVEDIANTLQDNPTVIIELGGTASDDESNPSKLSLERAKILKTLLVSEGIDDDRLEVKALGIEPYEIFDNDYSLRSKFGLTGVLSKTIIDSLQNPDLTNLAFKLNHSIRIKVLSAGYIPKR